MSPTSRAGPDPASSRTPTDDGTRNATARIEQRFTAPQDFKLWPQAERHTQWPGSGRKGDPFFDQFYASQVASLSDGNRSRL